VRRVLNRRTRSILNIRLFLNNNRKATRATAFLPDKFIFTIAAIIEEELPAQVRRGVRHLHFYRAMLVLTTLGWMYVLQSLGQPFLSQHVVLIAQPDELWM
jgi:hypothetical protein